MSSEQYRGTVSEPAPNDETATLSELGAGGAEAGGDAVFLPSEVLAGRFRVVRLLGRGGMGEIYEVEDFELGERVAVKTLRSQLAASDAALALFRSEIQLARRVTHPNVCRTFDVFRHRRRTGGRRKSVVFMTMELLDGETLSARLRRDAPLAPAEALPLAHQIAAALDAAHAAGIVHRDFKSGNVLLVDRADGGRAVITDFGLAGAVEEAVGTGSPYGTRPYRAPEQEAGEPAGPAADVYAFGIVLAEMLTGTADREEALRRLPPPLAALIRPCLTRRPEDRPARAGDVVRGLERLVRQEVPRRRRLLAATAAAVLALLPVAGLATWPLHEAGAAGPRGEAGAAPAPVPGHLQLAVVVAPVDSSAACEECLGFQLAELLSAELAGSGVEVMEPLDLYGAFGMAVAVQPSAPRRQGDGRVLGADLVAEMKIEDAGAASAELTVEVAAEDGGEPLARWRGRASARDMPRVAAELASRLRQALDLDPARPPESLRRRLIGDDAEALELYARGRHALSRGEPARAVELVRGAVAREPRALRFQLVLAEALREVSGGRSAALSAAQNARRLAGGLGGDLEREMTLIADAALARADKDWSRSADAALELARQHPERRSLGILTGRLLFTSGRYEEARQAVDALVATAPAADDDPRLLLLRADLLAISGDYPATLAAARAAGRRSREVGMTGTAFWAVYDEVEALRRSGRPREAAAAADRALALAEASGRRRWVGHALRWRGLASMDLGEGERAEAEFRQALETARETDDRTNAVWCLNNLAVRAIMTGELESATRLYAESLVLQRELASQRGILTVRSNLSEARLLQGRLADAEQEAREVLSGVQTLGSPQLESQLVERLAVIALERGELVEAGHLLDRLEEVAGNGERLMLPQVWARRAWLALLRGDPGTARRAAERAVELAGQLDNADASELALMARGRVELAEGRPEAALASYRQAAKLAAAEPRRIRLGSIERQLGEARRQLGDRPAARRHLQRALAEHERLGAELEEAHDRLALAGLYLDEADGPGAARLAAGALDAYRRIGDRDGAAAAQDLLERSRAAATAVHVAGAAPP